MIASWIRDSTKGREPFWPTLVLVFSLMAFLALLARTGIYGSGGRIIRKSMCEAKADICAIADAVNSYALEKGRLPDTLESLILPDEHGWRFLDCEDMPVDPWGRPYGYQPPAPGTAVFRVFSLGADGQPGGEGDDRDIDNLLIKEGKI
jgi:general secretion pathway protein G